MKRSIAKSFIDAGAGCNDDGEFQKFYYRREKSEVKLELRLHKPSAICYNLLSYLICLDGDGESFDEVLDDEEDDDDDHEERDEPAYTEPSRSIPTPVVAISHFITSFHRQTYIIRPEARSLSSPTSGKIRYNLFSVHKTKETR